MQEMHIRFLLWQAHSRIAAGFPTAEITCAGGDWSCWPLVHSLAEIPLWTQLHWVLLGCRQEIPSWQLWLHIWHFEGEYAESIGICAVANNPAVGTSDVSVDGCLQSRYGDDECSETSKGIQFYKIQVTQVCSRGRRPYFWPVIMAFCPPRRS